MDWDLIFSEKVKEIAPKSDPSHDWYHFDRVSRTARSLAEKEKAKKEVVVPAAWFHDFVTISKSDPRRTQASRISAEAAIEYLKSVNYPAEYFEEIRHAIEAHSFSAKIEAKTLEAKIVQDADRLEGIGAIGIARCFTIAGVLQRPYYNPSDPFCEKRDPDDGIWTVDHFFAKLFKTAQTMHTETAKNEALKRIQTMKGYLNELSREIRNDF